MFARGFNYYLHFEGATASCRYERRRKIACSPPASEMSAATARTAEKPKTRWKSAPVRVRKVEHFGDHVPHGGDEKPVCTAHPRVSFESRGQSFRRRAHDDRRARATPAMQSHRTNTQAKPRCGRIDTELDRIRTFCPIRDRPSHFRLSAGFGITSRLRTRSRKIESVSPN